MNKFIAVQPRADEGNRFFSRSCSSPFSRFEFYLYKIVTHISNDIDLFLIGLSLKISNRIIICQYTHTHTHTHTHTYIYTYWLIVMQTFTVHCPVGWSCRIHRLHLRRGVRPHPVRVLKMTLNNLMVRFQWCWGFGECGVPLNYHCSQVHPRLAWQHLIGPYLLVK